MRFKALLALATGLAAGLAVAATVPAEAKPAKKKRYENRAHYSITVRKHRNYLDAGTAVRPGEKSYHDYHRLLTSRFPTYGPAGPDNGEFRYPLPYPFELPGFGF
jgi:hypothetical protein